MQFRNLLKRKSKVSSSPQASQDEIDVKHEKSVRNENGQGQDDRYQQDLVPPVPVVQIMRSSTYSQELLTAPSFSPVTTMPPEKQDPPDSDPDNGNHQSAPKRSNTLKSMKSKRLSNLLSLNRRSRAVSSDMPRDLPPFEGRDEAPDSTNHVKTEEERQAQWEKRATLLVQDTTKPVSLPPSPFPPPGPERTSYDFTSQPPKQSVENHGDDWPLATPASHKKNLSATGSMNGAARSVEDKLDDDIQSAITLHEKGDLETSTSMFGRLADPSGANNALAQVLYGLALRHGWGIPSNPDLAVQYLTASARNASQLTSSLPTSSSSPTRKPSHPSSTHGAPASAPASAAGATLDRGSLTLALYELGNSHRNGWGVPKSLALAMQYFETAAELGDTDAMLEVAHAYETGVRGWRGGKKDRKMAAMWLRRAEGLGRREVGNSWIWKGKYD